MVARAHPKRPIALTIAGSDSGGGAGIQADLKVFAALSVHGTSAITCITAQNPAGVRGVHACQPTIVRKQIEAVMAELRPAAIKTGMLYSSAIIAAVADSLAEAPSIPVVVDPVMVASSGAPLLQAGAMRDLRRRLLPRAALITPNRDEAEILVRRRLRSIEDLRRAAGDLWGELGCAVLMKGGHLGRGREAVDIYFDGRDEWLLSAPFTRGVSTHGTGCTYAAAIAAYLARGEPLAKAVVHAKEFVSQAIAGFYRIGRHDALNAFWAGRVTPCA